MKWYNMLMYFLSIRSKMRYILKSHEITRVLSYATL